MEKIIEFSSLKQSTDQQSKKNDHHPQKPAKKYLIIMSILFVCLLTLVYLQIPISHIGKISVDGATLKEASYYAKQSDVYEGDSLWGYRNADVEERLANERTVKKVVVQRDLPNTVHIQLTEYKRVAYVRDDEKRTEYVLENGVVVRADEEVKEMDMPIMTGFTNEEVRQHTAEQLAKLDAELLHSISEIRPNVSSKNANYIKLYMTDGNEVRANAKTLASKLQYYPEMAEQVKNEQKKKGIFNLEVGEYFESYKKK